MGMASFSRGQGELWVWVVLMEQWGEKSPIEGSLASPPGAIQKAPSGRKTVLS